MVFKRFIGYRRLIEKDQKYLELSTFIQKSDFSELILELADTIFSKLKKKI